MQILLKTVLVIFCWLILSECLATPYAKTINVNALYSKPADKRISYGKDPLQFGDLRLPHGSGPYPVAIIIHGGCWISKFANLQNTAALADALRDLGVATWNIEYRSEDNNGGGWPGTFEDVAHAADFLQQIATQYSLDLNRVVAIGHSAGGHLALWLAIRHQLPTKSQLYMQHPIRLRGVVTLGGIPDLKAFRTQGEKVCGTDVVGNLLGDSPESVAKHYPETSPKELLPLGIPQILIYGAEDYVVPVELGHTYMQAARQKGDTVKLVVVKNAGIMNTLSQTLQPGQRSNLQFCHCYVMNQNNVRHTKKSPCRIKNVCRPFFKT